MPNTERAYRVLDLIKANEQNFDMGRWVQRRDVDYGPVGLDDLTAPGCGTTACFAGWALADAGYRFDEHLNVYSAEGHVLLGDIPTLAAFALGLDGEQADDLFSVSDDQIDEAVADIFGPRPDGA